MESLKAETWTALECQNLDFGPEVKELKAAFDHIETQIEFYLSTLQYVWERDLSLMKSWKDGKIQGVDKETNGDYISSVPSVLWKNHSDIFPVCFRHVFVMCRDFKIKIQPDAVKTDRLLYAFNRLIARISDEKDMDAVKYSGLDETTSGGQKIILYENYKKEIENNNIFIENLFTNLRSRTQWELWSWKMPEIENFQYDILRLTRKVGTKTLKRERAPYSFTRKVKG